LRVTNDRAQQTRFEINPWKCQAGHLGGDRSGRVKTRKQTTEPARVHNLEAFRHQFPRLPNTSAPVLVHDGQVILAVNPAMCRLLGARDKEIIGTKVIDWLPPQDQQSFLTRVSRSDTSPCQFNIISREKGELPIEISMVRISNWRGGQVRVVSLRRAGAAARQDEPRADALPKIGGGRG
jgi:PAS domain S-box-containing protein